MVSRLLTVTGSLGRIIAIVSILMAASSPASALRAAPRIPRAECSASVPLELRDPSRDIVNTCDLPLDDDVKPYPAYISPWTHVPECDYSADVPGKKFCVYTNARHGARGLSLLVTPETAADSANYLNKPLNRPLFDPSSLEIVDIPGKGKGVVARRRFKRYEQIMLDYASLVVDIALASEVPVEAGYSLLHTAVNQLSDPKSVLELGQSNDYSRDVVENVLRTNAFHTILGGEPHMALYPAVSVSFNLELMVEE